jgi:hypothetical protein
MGIDVSKAPKPKADFEYLGYGGGWRYTPEPCVWESTPLMV